MTLPNLLLPGCAHRPTVKQWIALASYSPREILYGGAAGGGKSDFLLMAALQFVDVPGYSAVIFRRTFPQLSAPEDGLLARAQEWLGPDPEFEGLDTISGYPTRWRFKGGGTLSFSHMQHESDRFNHQGPSYQFIGYDELTQFSESQYRYLLSRLRRVEGFPVPLRVRATSNPGGAGHDWVRERFPIDAPGVDGCRYIPAKLGDNPHLDSAPYAKTLEQLHPYERAQLLDGRWDVRPPGSRFQREWFPVKDARPAEGRRVRRWDLAATAARPGADPDWTAGVLMARTPEGAFVIEDVQRFRGSPGTVASRVTQQARIDGAEVAVRIEQEPGSSGKIAAHHWAKMLAGFDVRSVPSTGDKVVRSNPLASQAEAGNVSLVRGVWLEDYLRELEMFPGGSHDDQVDASSGARDDLTSGGIGPTEALAAMEAYA